MYKKRTQTHECRKECKVVRNVTKVYRDEWKSETCYIYTWLEAKCLEKERCNKVSEHEFKDKRWRTKTIQMPKQAMLEELRLRWRFAVRHIEALPVLGRIRTTVKSVPKQNLKLDTSLTASAAWSPRFWDSLRR
jgi:hypothetical protein